MELKTLAITVKGSNGTIDKIYEVELNCGAYEETRIFYVAYLSGWDMIIRIPALQDVHATTSAGTAPVTIPRPGMNRFFLRMWRENRVTYQKPNLSTAANSILARPDELAVRAAQLEDQFHPVAECSTLFPKAISREPLPL